MEVFTQVSKSLPIKHTLSELRLMNFFFMGFILYTMGFTLTSTGMVHNLICSAIQLMGILMFLPSSILLIELKFENIYFKVMIGLYIIYLCSVVFRGFLFDFVTIRDLLIDAWFGLFIYLAPIVCLFSNKKLLIKKTFDAIYILSIVFLIYEITFLNLLIERGSQESIAMAEVFSRTLGLPAGFVLLTYRYHSLKLRLVSGVTISVILAMALYQARRGLALYCLMILMFAGVIYLMKGSNRSFVLVTLLIFASSIVLVGSEVFDKSDFLSSIKERGLEDTRSNVELNFYEDMQGIDWLIGRGINGLYYCPGIVWDGEASTFRGIIETDYLQIILKGGLVSLGLLFLIMIPASILGIFFSKNLLVKAFGIWIFIGLLNMYPSSVNTFTLNYLIMWIGVGVCYSKSLRNLTDASIDKYFKKQIRN